jgi:hypothetical protein
MQIHGQINLHKQNNKLINTNWSWAMLGLKSQVTQTHSTHIAHGNHWNETSLSFLGLTINIKSKWLVFFKTFKIVM